MVGCRCDSMTSREWSPKRVPGPLRQAVFGEIGFCSELSNLPPSETMKLRSDDLIGSCWVDDKIATVPAFKKLLKSRGGAI